VVAYIYRPQAAIDASGQLVTAGAGQVFASPTGGSPLTVRNSAGLNVTQIQVSSIGQTELFEIDDYPELYWRSGSYVVHIFSITSMISAVEASQAAIDVAVASAAASAAEAQAARLAAEQAVGNAEGGPVVSVAGMTGVVTLGPKDVGLPNVNNTSDQNKPLSTAAVAALATKAAVSHTHGIDAVIGLQAVLDSKRGMTTPFDASLVGSGVLAPARLGQGAGDPSKFLAGDGFFRTPAGGNGGTGGGGVLNEVTVYGDSQVSNDTVYGGSKMFHQLLSEELGGVTVNGEGYGGADTPSVAGMAGAILTAITLTGGQIPATGGVAASSYAPNDALQAEYEMNEGWLVSPTGTSVLGLWTGGPQPGSTRTFVRSSPGTAVPIADGTYFQPKRARHEGTAAIMMSGGNDPGHGISEARRIEAFKAVGRRFGSRFVAISSVPVPAQAADLYAGTEAALAAEFGSRHLNAREFLRTYGLKWAGLTPTADDTADIAAGRVPRQLFHTDNIHLNETARRVLARRVAQILVGTGIITPGTATAPSDTTKPTAPTSLASSGLTSSSVTLNWGASSDNVGVAGYNVYQNGALVATPNGTTAIISTLSPGQTYSFVIRARDAAGNVSDPSSSVSVTTPASSDTTPPSVPSGLAASSITSTGFQLTWTVSTDNVGVKDYDVQIDGVSYPVAWGTTTNALEVTGRTPDTPYQVRVRARDAAGNPSALSAAIEVRTAATGGGGTFPIDGVMWRYDSKHPGATISGGKIGSFLQQGEATGVDLYRNTGNQGASVVTVGGVDWVRGDTVFETASAQGTKAHGDLRSFAAVIQLGDFSTFRKMFQIRAQGTAEQWEGYIGADATKWSARGNSGDEVVNNSQLGATTAKVLIVTYAPTTGAVSLYIDGVVHASGSSAWTNIAALKYLSVEGYGTTLSWAELIADDRQWTSQEISDLTAHLKAKYGIA